MSEYKFIATQTDNGSELIELIKEDSGGLFRRATNEKVQLNQWSICAPASGLTAIASCRALDYDGEINEGKQSIIIPADVIARLNDIDGISIGLPPVTALTLQLRSGGSLAEGSINVETRWIRRGGQPVRAEITGARVREGTKTARIVEPLFSCYKMAHDVSAAQNPDDRRSAFADLRMQLGDKFNNQIDADGFIEKIRIAYAANFSLDAKTINGRFDFDPVLFSRHTDETDDGDLIDATEKSLLTVAENLDFQTKFRGQGEGSRSYLMPDGTLLFLDPLLGKALDVVRNRQKASSVERRSFLSAPQKIIREELKLDDRDDDEIADRLFVETRQFSERVSGIEIWQKPVLPWIKPKPNSWLPESFGLRLGDPPNDKYIELNYGDATQISNQVKQALSDNVALISWEGEDIPASPATLRAVSGIADLEQQIAKKDGPQSSQQNTALPLDTFFLQVGQNFENLEYTRIPSPAILAKPFIVPSLPEGLVSSPQPHQLQAFAWMTEAFMRKLPGILLADDMGLGKTFEALMFLAWLKQESIKHRPVLIIAPTGLLRNWQSEIRQHLENGLLGPIVEAFGNGLANYRNSTGNDIRGGTSRLEVDDWEKAGVILTTYETMRDYHMSFARIHFGAVIYDEIQKLKNPASQMTRAAKALNADMQIGMTGTPVENRLQDLWSITDTIYPGFLGASRDFEREYPANDRDKLADLQSRLIETNQNLPAFMLRRMKDDILTGLPQKSSRRYSVDMPPEQALAYDHVLGRARAMRECGEKGAMLKVLHMLRGTSLHPHPPRGITNIDTYIDQSARLRQTFNILQSVKDNGEKALVFCEDLEMQSFLSMAIQEKFQMERAPDCINGNVAGGKRQAMVSAYQARPKGFDVIILSPKAGGVGLTITAANHVIHLSRWWNPAVEDQATDRVYRIGQNRPVTVHLPLAIHPNPAIASSSFDKRLDDLMEKKRALSRGLLLPPESDSDTEILLSEVLDGVTKSLDISHNTEALELKPTRNTKPPKNDTNSIIPAIEPAALLLKQTSTENTRPILSSQLSPIESAEARTPELRRVEYKQGGIRDWGIFDQYIQNALINRLEVTDPYCCSSKHNTGYLLNFIKRFAEKSTRLDNVQIATFDATTINSNDYATNSIQRSDFEERWSAFLNDIKFQLVQRSRRADQDFHDRIVKAHLANGDTIIWDLGRGIEGVMSARRACVVNAHKETKKLASIVP